MGPLKRGQQRWEALARTDGLWAICADPEKRNGKWSREEFFATGKKEVDAVLARVRSLGLEPDPTSRALDFGCGVGRLTRALAPHFRECWGVDISSTMVANAIDYNRDVPNCHFCINQAEHLRIFPGHYFGFIYSSIVLQHIELKLVKRYLREMVRVLRPGGVLVFQIADHVNAELLWKLRMKLGFRRRLNEVFAMENTEIVMHYMNEAAVRRLLASEGVEIRDVCFTNSADPQFNGNLQYAEHEPANFSVVSKQYCVVKKK